MPHRRQSSLLQASGRSVQSPENATILTKLQAFFRVRSAPAYLVGGFLRDSLRGTDTEDVDIAVHGDSLSLAQEMAIVLGGTFVPLSAEHRVARVALPSSGDNPNRNGPVIDVSAMDSQVYANLARRDFTVDAMALELDHWGTPGWEGSVLDRFDGRSDLAKGVIRAVGDSVFQDDPARLLRAVRLAAKLHFSIDPSTAEMISRDAHLVAATSGERIREEFLAILSLDRAKEHLETLDQLGLLCCIIPELEITKGMEQPREHYWDVYGHSIHAIEGAERVVSRHAHDHVATQVPWSGDMEEYFRSDAGDGHTRATMLKLAALLHDIAKPQTKMIDPTGRTRFLGHQTQGASMADVILERIRLSKRGKDMVHGMVENHLRPMQMSQGDELPTARAVYRYFRDVGDVAIDTLYLSLADHLAARGPELDSDGWRRHADIVAHILEIGTHQQTPEKTLRLINGHDLMEEFSLAPGPLLGYLLEELNEAQASGSVSTRDEALDWLRGKLDLVEDGGMMGEGG